MLRGVLRGMRRSSLGLVSRAAAVLLVAWVWAPHAAAAADHPMTFPAGVFPNYSYAPPNTDAAVGDTVTFSGAFAGHPLVWNDGDFPTQSGGATNTYTFTRPGTFAFHCQIHASMVGSVHVPGNAFATSDFSWGPASPKTGQAVTFTPGAFTDPDGTVVRYEWDLDGNGTFEATGAAPSRTYTSAGNYNVALRYVDDGHETSPATTHVLTVAQGTISGGGGGAGGGGGGTGGGGTPSPSPTTPSPAARLRALGAPAAGRPPRRVVASRARARAHRARPHFVSGSAPAP
jgi:plastocyanin